MDIIPIIGVSVWLIAKVLFLFGLGIYLIFSLVVLRQVNLMTDTLEIGFETVVRFLAILHFLLAVAVFIFALLIL